MSNQITVSEIADAVETPMTDQGAAEDVDLSGLTAFEVIGKPGEPDLVVELIDLYLKDGSERVRQIKCAAVTSDRILLKKAVHTLKGSSGSLGFHQIVELCKALERIDGQDNLKTLVEQLEFRFTNVCNALRNFRESRVG